MRLNVEKLKEVMEKVGITEEMLIVICGLENCGSHPINSEHFIAPMRVRKIARVLEVDTKEIVIEDYEGELQNEFND